MAVSNISSMDRGIQDWSELKLERMDKYEMEWLYKYFVRFRLMTCQGNTEIML